MVHFPTSPLIDYDRGRQNTVSDEKGTVVSSVCGEAPSTWSESPPDETSTRHGAPVAGNSAPKQSALGATVMKKNYSETGIN